MEEDRNALKHSIVKPIENKHLGRRECRWEDDIRIYLNEIRVNTRNRIN